jgi:hypothetical protein
MYTHVVSPSQQVYMLGVDKFAYAYCIYMHIVLLLQRNGFLSCLYAYMLPKYDMWGFPLSNNFFPLHLCVASTWWATTYVVSCIIQTNLDDVRVC